MSPSDESPPTQMAVATTSSSRENLKAKSSPSDKKSPPKKKSSSKKHKSVLQTKLHKLSLQIGYIGKLNNEILLKINQLKLFIF